MARLGDDAALRQSIEHRLGVSAAFVYAARCYWLSVFPQVRTELRHWRALAERIPDPRLRRLALETQRIKWCNAEGAAAFAVLAPPASRSATISALLAYQAAYDYADTLSELPAADTVANGRSLHRPLIAALERDGEHPDYYAHSHLGNDGGYLQALTDRCRGAFESLPGHHLVREGVRRASRRIVTYQSLHHGDADALKQLARWAARETPSGSELRWWETAAACASSLSALALISVAADPSLQSAHVEALESAYHPWIGALHTLLDSLVDWSEDERAGQRSLLDNYASGEELTERMRVLAVRSHAAIATLTQFGLHAALLSGMVSVYLVAPEARTARTAAATDAVLQASGSLTAPSLAILRLRRAVRAAALAPAARAGRAHPGGGRPGRARPSDARSSRTPPSGARRWRGAS